jgi:hypothetical protein
MRTAPAFASWAEFKIPYFIKCDILLASAIKLGDDYYFER